MLTTIDVYFYIITVTSMSTIGDWDSELAIPILQGIPTHLKLKRLNFYK